MGREVKPVTIVKVKTRIADAREKLKLLPGEELMSACSSAEGCTPEKLAAKDVGGFVGRALARHRIGRPPEDGGMSTRFPNGSGFYVGLTNRRMIVTNVVAPTLNPTRVVAAYGKDDVIAIVWDETAADTVAIAFIDGTAVKFKVAHDNSVECLPEGFLEW